MLPNEGWKPLKLKAEDDEDLEIFSECLYESIFSIKEMKFVEIEKSFIMTLERFTWECAFGKDEELRQVLSVVVFQNINAMELNFQNKYRNKFLNLKSIACEKDIIVILFNYENSINLKTSKLECSMEDIGKPIWPALTPGHFKNIKN